MKLHEVSLKFHGKFQIVKLPSPSDKVAQHHLPAWPAAVALSLQVSSAGECASAIRKTPRQQTLGCDIKNVGTQHSVVYAAFKISYRFTEAQTERALGDTCIHIRDDAGAAQPAPRIS